MSNRAAAQRRPEPTTTSAFGAGRRESHDASGFYARFEAPELSASDEVIAVGDFPQGAAACIQADSRHLVLPDGDPLPGNCVGLIVTSPPYFSGKEYERALGKDGVPGSYLEYLDLLRDVFAECKRVLEPGGRIAVNVANLGRKPYRSLASDIVRILQDDLRLLLRGEIVWRKGEGASGSCAWGSYLSARNPVLRDTTERVIVASKGRFDRALNERERNRRGLPFENDIAPDEFMEATLDVWNIAPESARRVQHPAPFPVELPERLIGLYSYLGDVVLDPFMGSGTALVAAIRTGRRYLGYDTDPHYVSIARRRVSAETTWRSDPSTVEAEPPNPATSARPARARGHERLDEAERRERLRKAASRRKSIQSLAEEALTTSGFSVAFRGMKIRGLGLPVDFVARDALGHQWFVEVVGSFSAVRGGLTRTDAAWGAVGKASALVRTGRSPVLLLTSQLPKQGTEAEAAIRTAGPGIVFDVLELLDDQESARLRAYALGGNDKRPAIGFWTASEIESM